MKILFCLGSMRKGGAERVVATLSNELVKKYDVSIVVTVCDKPMYELSKNINYYCLDNYKSSHSIFRNISRIIRLRRIFKEEKPDVIISFLPDPTLRVLIAKTFLNIKTIISDRNDPNVEYRKFMKRILVKLLFPLANGFVFQTEDAKKWYSNRIQKKSLIIPNPIDSNFICKPYEGVRDKCIVSVGRLVEQKNHFLLIDSFKLFAEKHNDYVLRIYGDGYLNDKLSNYINNLNLDKKVFLMGKTDDVKESIYKAGIFVLSSDYEGMPNSLMEAMALGIPCISTDCPIGGPKSLIKNNINGILVKVNNKIMLANAMNFLAENYEFSCSIGKNANNICRDLNPKLISSKWEEYIFDVLNREVSYEKK